MRSGGLPPTDGGARRAPLTSATTWHAVVIARGNGSEPTTTEPPHEVQGDVVAVLVIGGAITLGAMVLVGAFFKWKDKSNNRRRRYHTI